MPETTQISQNGIIRNKLVKAHYFWDNPRMESEEALDLSKKIISRITTISIGIIKGGLTTVENI
jgi:hypothetical protein